MNDDDTSNASYLVDTAAGKINNATTQRHNLILKSNRFVASSSGSSNKNSKNSK